MMQSIVDKGRQAWQRARLGSASGFLPAMATVASLTLLVKVVSAAKEMQVARSLGVGDSLDAFYIGFLLPSIIINVVGASLNTALIPTYIQVRERDGRQAAYRLYSSMMVCSLALLAALACLLVAFFPAIVPHIAPSFSPSKLATTRSLFLILVPVVLLTGISTTWGGVLNATNRFALVALTPIVTPITVVTSLLAFGRTYGIYSLAGATLVGAAIEAAVLGCGLLRLRIPLGFRWYGLNADLKHVLQLYAPVAAASLIFSGTSFADQSIAARLGSGAVASLAYGNKLVTFTTSVSVTAVASSVLPHFSQMVAAKNWPGIRTALRASTIVILLATIPLAVGLSLGAAPLVRLLFQHGAFTVADTRLVSRVQICYAVGIPVYTLAALYLRLIAAMRINKRIFVTTACNVVLNFLLDIAFARYMGVAGIALSTSVVSLSSCVTFYLALRGPLARAERESAAADETRFAWQESTPPESIAV